ncbi:MAG: alpha/beta hydrolase [Cyanobacteria bacterium P01_F01_bin.116]
MDGSSVSLQNQRSRLDSKVDLRCLILPADDLTDWDGLINQVVNLVSIEKKSYPHRLIYLCGESFGGCLALKLVARSAELFDRLILINPASSFHRQPWRYLGPELVKQTPTLLYQLATVGFLPFLVSMERTSNENRLALLQAMQSVTPKSAAWRLSLLRDFRLEDLSLDRFAKPTLMIASRADQLLASSLEAKKLAEFLPNLQNVTLRHSGHACLLESEVDLYKILTNMKFLN